MKSSNYDNDYISSEYNTKWRVKYYILNKEGQWTDIGTGYIFIIKKVIFFNITLILGRIYLSYE